MTAEQEILESLAGKSEAEQHAILRQYAETHGITGRKAFEMFTDAGGNASEKFLALRRAIDDDYEARLKLTFCTDLLAALVSPPEEGP